MINSTFTARKYNSAALGTYIPPHWNSKAPRSISEGLEASCKVRTAVCRVRPYRPKSIGVALEVPDQ